MVLIALGALFIAWVLIQVARYAKVRSWHQAEGLITHSSNETFKQPEVFVVIEKVKPVVEYTYEVENQKYTGSAISIEDRTLKVNSESKAYPWPNFTLNQKCTVYINPDNPSDAVLINTILPYRISHYAALSITGVLLMLIGIGISYA